MSDILISIGEEMELRYGMDVDFWMTWVMNNPILVPDDIKEAYGRSLFG